MRAKTLSERFRDRPKPPMETALYWIDYAVRHKKTKFMRTAAVDMPAYQYYLIDVIAFIVLVLGIVIYSVYKGFSVVFRIVFCRRKKVKTN